MIPRLVGLVLAGTVSMTAWFGSAEAAGPFAAAHEIRRSARMATPVHDWRERDRAWLHHRRAIDRHHHVAPGGLCVDYQPFTSLSCHTFLRHQVRPHGFHDPHHFNHGHHTKNHGHHMNRHRGGSSRTIILR